MAHIIHVFRKNESKILLRRGLTGVIGLKRQTKLVFRHGGIGADERLAMSPADRKSNSFAVQRFARRRKADGLQQIGTAGKQMTRRANSAEQSRAVTIRANIEAVSK